MVISLFYINVYYCNEITCILMKDFDIFFLCHLVEKQTNNETKEQRLLQIVKQFFNMKNLIPINVNACE